MILYDYGGLESLIRTVEGFFGDQMDKKNLGQYDDEYVNCPCFWGTSPGKFVKLIKKYVHEGVVLDIGAGEGKNSIYLANEGYEIVAIECSKYAINNFEIMLDKSNVSSKVNIINQDILTFIYNRQFDVIIAYGLLHCLPSINDAFNVINLMKKNTTKRGINIVVTFTPELPIPPSQSYLHPTFIKPEQLKEWYGDWEILEYEKDVIEESHPTSNIPHRHSLVRLLARKL